MLVEKPLTMTVDDGWDLVQAAASGEDVGYATGEDGAKNREVLEQIVA